MTTLIYCAGGNAHFAQIAIEQGFRYGAQLPSTVYFPLYFADQDWKRPDREKYIKALTLHKPAWASVLDWEHDDQFDEVLSWAVDASTHVTQGVIIIPKVTAGIERIPVEICGKRVRLGYSVPTKFGSTSVPMWEFRHRPVHLLGGSPRRQMELARYLNVASADGNYVQKVAVQWNGFFTPIRIKWSSNGFFPKLEDLYMGGIAVDAPYHAFRLSCINIFNAWHNVTRYAIRYGVARDLPHIDRIVRQHPSAFGFVRRSSLQAAIDRFEVYVLWGNNDVMGFIHFHHRRDGWHTVYNIGVDQSIIGTGAGYALLNAIPRPIRLKCTSDNTRANNFYERYGMTLARVETGNRRTINVWEITHDHQY